MSLIMTSRSASDGSAAAKTSEDGHEEVPGAVRVAGSGDGADGEGFPRAGEGGNGPVDGVGEEGRNGHRRHGRAARPGGGGRGRIVARIGWEGDGVLDPRGGIDQTGSTAAEGAPALPGAGRL